LGNLDGGKFTRDTERQIKKASGKVHPFMRIKRKVMNVV
jgi:hypothetical protein